MVCGAFLCIGIDVIVFTSIALFAFSLLVVLANLRVIKVAVFTFVASPIKEILAQRHVRLATLFFAAFSFRSTRTF